MDHFLVFIRISFIVSLFYYPKTKMMNVTNHDPFSVAIFYILIDS